MNNDADQIIAMLSPEIERECAEIKQARRENTCLRLFILLCMAVIVIPTVFVFLSFSLISLFVPAIFTGIAFLLLSPILINQQGGHAHEQV